MCGTNGGVIYAKSTKQKLVTLSSTEAEIVAVHDVLMRGIQVNNILIELGEKIKPIKLLQDNMSTICLLTKISVNSIKSKYINVRYFFTRDMVREGILEIEYCSTDQMIADILTKPLFGQKFVIMKNWLLNKVSSIDD